MYKSFTSLVRFILRYFIFWYDYLKIIYLGLCWVFVAACGLSLALAGGGYSGCDVRASRCVASFVAERGLQARRFRELQHAGSVVAVQSSLPCSMGSLPRRGGKPKSTALAGSFLTTGHQGSPGMIFKGFFADDV